MAVKRRKVPLRWDAAKEKMFLEMLTMTSCVTDSAKACRMSVSSVYNRRRTRPKFQAKWDEALDQGYARLEANLLDEALNGVFRTVIRDGKEVVEREPAPERTRLALLSAHARRVGAIRARNAVEPNSRAAKARARMEAKFRKLARRIDPDADLEP